MPIAQPELAEPNEIPRREALNLGAATGGSGTDRQAQLLGAEAEGATTAWCTGGLVEGAAR